MDLGCILDIFSVQKLAFVKIWDLAFFAPCAVVAEKTLIPFVFRLERGAFEMYLSSEIAPNAVNNSETFVAYTTSFGSQISLDSSSYQQDGNE